MVGFFVWIAATSIPSPLVLVLFLRVQDFEPNSVTISNRRRVLRLQSKRSSSSSSESSSPPILITACYRFKHLHRLSNLELLLPTPPNAASSPPRPRQQHALLHQRCPARPRPIGEDDDGEFQHRAGAAGGPRGCHRVSESRGRGVEKGFVASRGRHLALKTRPVCLSRIPIPLPTVLRPLRVPQRTQELPYDQVRRRPLPLSSRQDTRQPIWSPSRQRSRAPAVASPNMTGTKTPFHKVAPCCSRHHFSIPRAVIRITSVSRTYGAETMSRPSVVAPQIARRQVATAS